MNIGKVSSTAFKGNTTKGYNLQNLKDDNLSPKMKEYREAALLQLDEQHSALFTALNAQMVQNQFELLNRLDKIEKKVNDIHWQTGGKYTDPLAPFM